MSNPGLQGRTPDRTQDEAPVIAGHVPAISDKRSLSCMQPAMIPNRFGSA
jgi:hypothetical protein